MATLVRWNPWRELEAMRTDLDRVFGRRFGAVAEEGGWSPAVDVIEEADAVVLKADLPGMSADDIEIECDDDLLTIKGERKFEEITEKEGYRRIERGYGRFERTFSMPKGAKTDESVATFHDGILEIRVPKPSEAPAKKIPIGS